MFCPRCAQQQLNDESRFCPRCGLPLAGVAALLASDGLAPQGQAVTRDNELNGKRKGIRRGAKIIFLSVVLAPVFFALSIVFDSPGPLLVPVSVFLAGLSWLLYSLIFGEGPMPAWGAKAGKELTGARTSPTLAAPPFVPASSWLGAQRADTAEMVPPFSVTEHSTKLLEEERRK
jgi:hypothetical protein